MCVFCYIQNKGIGGLLASMFGVPSDQVEQIYPGQDMDFMKSLAEDIMNYDKCRNYTNGLVQEFERRYDPEKNELFGDDARALYHLVSGCLYASGHDPTHHGVAIPLKMLVWTAYMMGKESASNPDVPDAFNDAFNEEDG